MIHLALRVVRKRYGDLKAIESAPRPIKDCQAAYVEAGLSWTAANCRVRQVRGFFRWLVTEELIPPRAGKP